MTGEADLSDTITEIKGHRAEEVIQKSSSEAGPGTEKFAQALLESGHFYELVSGLLFAH